MDALLGSIIRWSDLINNFEHSGSEVEGFEAGMKCTDDYYSKSLVYIHVNCANKPIDEAVF